MSALEKTFRKSLKFHASNRSHKVLRDIYFWHHHPACRILIPQPGIEPPAPQQ